MRCNSTAALKRQAHQGMSWKTCPGKHILEKHILEKAIKFLQACSESRAHCLF
jgi:hypothetical protein